jgi:hypothetical protein
MPAAAVAGLLINISPSSALEDWRAAVLGVSPRTVISEVPYSDPTESTKGVPVCTPGGGGGNTAGSISTTVGSGESNTASGNYSVISGGQGVEASQENAAVGSG